MKRLQIRLFEGQTHNVERDANRCLEAIPVPNLVSVEVSSPGSVPTWESSGRSLVAIVYVEEQR